MIDNMAKSLNVFTKKVFGNHNKPCAIETPVCCTYNVSKGFRAF